MLPTELREEFCSDPSHFHPMLLLCAACAIRPLCWCGQKLLPPLRSHPPIFLRWLTVVIVFADVASAVWSYISKRRHHSAKEANS